MTISSVRLSLLHCELNARHDEPPQMLLHVDDPDQHVRELEQSYPADVHAMQFPLYAGSESAVDGDEPHDDEPV